MSSVNTDFQIIQLLTEYIPRKKQVFTQSQHAMNQSYICANPDGPVYNFDCPEDDPLCNCPCRDLRPNSSEVVSYNFCKQNYLLFGASDITKIFAHSNDPSNLTDYAIIKGIYDSQTESSVATIYKLVDFYDTEAQAKQVLKDAISNDGVSGASGGITYDEPSEEYMDSLLQSTSECELINEKLGEKWLGCDIEDPNSPYSCDCPCVGEMYHYYLKFNKTAATFWDTPGYVPLISMAHRAALVSQQIAVSIKGDLSLRPGDLIELDLTEPPKGSEKVEEIARKYGIITDAQKNVKFTGKWLISSIKHVLSGSFTHKMELILIRDGLANITGNSE